MRKLMILLLGAILIGILSYFCFLDKAAEIKEDLVSKTQRVYAGKDMNWVDTGIKGSDLAMTRILTLNGTAPSEALKAEAEKIALAQDGVDGVQNYLTVTTVDTTTLTEETTEPAVAFVSVPSPYMLDVQKDKDLKVVLRGYVADLKMHEELVSHAKTLYGDVNVTDELKEEAGAPLEWVASAKLGLDKLHKLQYGEYNISNQDFYFKGYVESVDTKDILISQIEKELFGGNLGHYDIEAAVVEPKVVENKEAPVYSCQDAFIKILSSKKIHFEYNKADVKPLSYPLLDALAEVVKKCPNDIVSIEGHTDSIGSKDYNKKLSASRANVVKDYLVSKGIPEERLLAVGVGEARPIADNMVKAGRAQNRRIEFNVKGVK